MDMSSVLRKIQKLLALAEDGRGDPNTAAIAAGQAAKLMTEFNLDHADVMAKVIDRGEAELDTAACWANMKGDKKAKQPRRNPQWAGWLAIRVGKLNDCGVRFDYSADMGAHVRFFGMKSDVQIAAWMFDYLVGEMVKGVRTFQARAPRGKDESASFRTGFVLALCASLRALEREKATAMQAGVAGRALVVSKAQAIAVRFGTFNYGKAKHVNVSADHAYAAGSAAGSRVDVARRAVAGNHNNAKALA